MIKYISLALALALATSVEAQQSASSTQTTDQTYLDFQVDQVVRIKNPVAPTYPERLRASRIDGSVIVQYVVDERGNAQMNTFKVLKSSDQAFTDAVKAAVSSMSFHPAEKDGRSVKQLVQQPFRFAASR